MGEEDGHAFVAGDTVVGGVDCAWADADAWVGVSSVCIVGVGEGIMPFTSRMEFGHRRYVALQWNSPQRGYALMVEMA